jgi:DNA-binding NtrC family response regulator
MMEVLDSLGPEVEALCTADEGYSFLQKHAHEVAVLVTDVRMLGQLDGLDLTNLVAQKWPHIDVVLTSGYDIGSLSDLGAVNQFLAKPWSIDQLSSVVSALLSKTGSQSS